MQKLRVTSPRMRTAEIGNFLVTKNRTEQEGGSPAAILAKFGNSNPYYLVLSVYFKTPFWLIIDNNDPYPQ